ncbi:cytosine permease [Spirillospora sp. CA-142024]|uniref:cytosine permease n=1 Tax=Spirillospora sp. CA-142024 TaxID=3240036 RepID=UPI003D8B1A14
MLDLVIEILAELGVHGGSGTRYLVAGLIMAVQLGLALSQAEPDWTGAAAATTGDEVTAVTQLLTAIGIGWGITWLPYSADYSRFVRTEASDRAVFWSTALGMYVPTVWLAALGACLASAGGGSDPSSLVTGAFGVMAIPVLLLVMHGPVATNILNLYSCSLAALSVGIRVARWKVTLVAGAVASAVLAVV